MLDCPRCSKPTYDGTSCSACGFAAGTKIKAPRDPMHGICEHVRDGQRCAKLGTLSPNLRGGDGKQAHPGPWYCWQHFAEVILNRPDGRDPEPPPKGFQALKDLVKPIARKPLREPGQDDEEANRLTP